MYTLARRRKKRQWHIRAMGSRVSLCGLYTGNVTMQAVTLGRDVCPACRKVAGA